MSGFRLPDNVPSRLCTRLRFFVVWFAAFAAGLLWFRVDGDWRRLRHIPNLMIAAAALDLLMVLLYRQQVTAPALNLLLYCGHLILFGVIGLLLHGLQYGHSTSGSRRLVEAAEGTRRSAA